MFAPSSSSSSGSGDLDALDQEGVSNLILLSASAATRSLRPPRSLHLALPPMSLPERGSTTGMQEEHRRRAGISDLLSAATLALNLKMDPAFNLTFITKNDHDEDDEDVESMRSNRSKKRRAQSVSLAVDQPSPSQSQDGHRSNLFCSSTSSDPGKIDIDDEVIFLEDREDSAIKRLMQQRNIGEYSPSEREELLRKYLAKRGRRNWKKKIRYGVRKDFADRRLRVKGRFIRKEDEAQLLEHQLFHF